MVYVSYAFNGGPEGQKHLLPENDLFSIFDGDF